MRRMLAVMRRNLQNMRKSPRVADETMFGDPNGAINEELPIFVRRSGWNGFSVIQSVVRAPLALLSCVSQPHIAGGDGAWASSELARISEMNHLMVNDSLRYAILM
ncbi:Zinc finger and BTB domain-containing protein [Actinidia chinensis var. chinensis]|uniref:Zinc finger and BTB domain-containing protein n=1 Tax=Actinidia chinensis var. chinensis TaxID=1590841 RepID=A0A2R6QWH8_ACTCC|nr:Zinc finger and BTB domain-containing protein [Actinidia chinensis var. chinensis]